MVGNRRFACNNGWMIAHERCWTVNDVGRDAKARRDNKFTGARTVYAAVAVAEFLALAIGALTGNERKCHRPWRQHGTFQIIGIGRAGAEFEVTLMSALRRCRCSLPSTPLRVHTLPSNRPRFLLSSPHLYGLQHQRVARLAAALAANVAPPTQLARNHSSHQQVPSIGPTSHYHGHASRRHSSCDLQTARSIAPGSSFGTSSLWKEVDRAIVSTILRPEEQKTAVKSQPECRKCCYNASTRCVLMSTKPQAQVA